MDSYCATIKAKMLPVRKGGNGFFGEKIRGRLKDKAFGTRLWKNLSGKGTRNLQPGVAFSVLTRDINKEMAVKLDDFIFMNVFVAVN